MKRLWPVLLVAIIFTACTCRNNNNAVVPEQKKDTLAPKAPADFVGEYFNPNVNETTPDGLRLMLAIKKDSIENQYLLSFTTVKSDGKDSCSLQAKGINRNDTLFTSITTGVDTALMYIAFLPQKKRKALDVFSTRFKDKDVLAKFCHGNASIIGVYEQDTRPKFDSTIKELGFIRSFPGKKAGEVQLFKFVILKERLEKMLGEEEFGNLRKNWVIEEPIDSLSDGIYKVSACKTPRCNIYKTTIFFDLQNDNITVIISKKGDNNIISEKPSLPLPEAIVQEIEKEGR